MVRSALPLHTIYIIESSPALHTHTTTPFETPLKYYIKHRKIVCLYIPVSLTVIHGRDAGRTRALSRGSNVRT